jgi:predicted nucleic acid-binding protein
LGAAVIVVDTSILAYLLLPGHHTPAADSLLDQDPEWAAPVLWRSEFRNVLAGEVRRGGIALEQACRLQAEAEDLMSGNEYDVDSTQVLTLVRESECSAYGCEYVALAVTLGAKLVTRDAQVLRSFPGVAVTL